MTFFEEKIIIHVFATGLDYPPRCRSMEVSVLEPLIAFRGRCGASNREEYEECIEEMGSRDGFVTSFEMDYVYGFYLSPWSRKIKSMAKVSR